MKTFPIGINGDYAIYGKIVFSHIDIDNNKYEIRRMLKDRYNTPDFVDTKSRRWQVFKNGVAIGSSKTKQDAIDNINSVIKLTN